MIDLSNLTKINLPQTNDVSLASEENRFKSVFKSLDLINKDINDCIAQLDEKNDYILIKPNCVEAYSKTCATHVDALYATLDFIKGLWQGKVILAEGSAQNTLTAFKNYGYEEILSRYENIEFLDLNFSDAIFVDIFDKDLKRFQIKISNTLVSAPLRISVGPPKTHNSVIVTLSIKNMAVGAISGDDKSKIHQGPKAINRSIAKLFEYTHPHISVIDGWQGMEGNGPVGGKMVDTRFAVSSLNALAADCLVTEMMGFDPNDIGYLNILGSNEMLKKIKVLGLNPTQFQFNFKPHKSLQEQLKWQ